MKKIKIFYWVSTIIIFLFQGVMPALTSHTEMAKEGIRHLGYPEYFSVMLAVFKVAGSIVILLPWFSNTLKEWAYAGFTFDFLAASISNSIVDGFGMGTWFPLIVLVILMISYYTFGLLRKPKSSRSPVV
jgi:DoxX-like protein